MAEYHPETLEIRRRPLKYVRRDRPRIPEQIFVQNRQIQHSNPNPMGSQNPDQKRSEANRLRPIMHGPSQTEQRPAGPAKDFRSPVSISLVEVVKIHVVCP